MDYRGRLYIFIGGGVSRGSVRDHGEKETSL